MSTLVVSDNQCVARISKLAKFHSVFTKAKGLATLLSLPPGPYTVKKEHEALVGISSISKIKIYFSWSCFYNVVEEIEFLSLHFSTPIMGISKILKI